MATLLRKQKRIGESSKWFLRAVKSAVGIYTFDLNDDALNQVQKAYEKEKTENKNKDAHIGGILLEAESMFFAFISFMLARADVVQDCLPIFISVVLISGVAAVAGLFACVPRILKRERAKKHIVTLVLAIVSIGLLIGSLCSLM